MPSIQEIALALRSIATPGMKPKALRAAIRERYPDVSKKEIVRAAFYAVTEEPSAQELHNFAMSERISEDNAGEVLQVSKRKKRHADGEKRSQPH
jgi:hypothetical protein